MTEFTSKQVQILKPDYTIYNILSDFNNFTPIVQDKIEEWTASEDSCSFKVNGFVIKLKMVDKEPYKTIKLTGDQLPFEFYFWIQLKSVAPEDTRMRLTIHGKMNMLMKAMIGKKLQDGLDKIADQIAFAFNNYGR